MPTTNDVNEGALGCFHVMMHCQPQLSLLEFNAKTMFVRNDTAEFMEKHFSPETHQYIWELAHQPKTEEKTQKQDIVKYNEEKIAKRLEKKKKRGKFEQLKLQTEFKVFSQFGTIYKAEIDKLTGDKLKDHVKVFIGAGAINLKDIKSSSTQPQQRIAIKEAIDQFNPGDWVLQPGYRDPAGIVVNGKGDKDSESSDGEVFEGYNEVSGSDSEWKDEEDEGD